MKIAFMPGDGIGREVATQALRVLREMVPNVETEEAPIGMAGIEARGMPLPPETITVAKRNDAILFGAVGAPGEEHMPRDKRPGTGLLELRLEMQFFANYRPAFLFPELMGASSLRPEIVKGLDLVILRELNGDLYFGKPRGIETDAKGERHGINTMRYSESEVERIAHAAFRLARMRRKKVCSVDKANVLETMQLWRETVIRVGKHHLPPTEVV